MTTFERALLFAVLIWAACAVMAHLAHCAERMPMPERVTPGEKLGCDIKAIVNEHTVNLKDLKKPRLCWITRVFTEHWKGFVFPARETEAAAHKDCTQWRNAIEAEALKEQKQEVGRAK